MRRPGSLEIAVAISQLSINTTETVVACGVDMLVTKVSRDTLHTC